MKFMEENLIITAIKRVVLVGKDEYKEDFTSFKHPLTSNELIFHISGHASVYFDDLVLETAPNTVRFLPMGCQKRYDVLRHERGECIDVGFLTDRPFSDTAFITDVRQNEKIGALFKKLFAVWASRGEGYYFESIGLLYRILAELQKGSYAPSAHEKKIAPALALIQNEFLLRELSVPELATVCSMSESYFTRLFKEKYGVPPKKYIIGLKINHACDLLRLDRYTVSQVADLCAFSDVFYFSRLFREVMGITPTQFVKKYKSSK